MGGRNRDGGDIDPQDKPDKQEAARERKKNRQHADESPPYIGIYLRTHTRTRTCATHMRTTLLSRNRTQYLSSGRAIPNHSNKTFDASRTTPGHSRRSRLTSRRSQPKPSKRRGLRRDTVGVARSAGGVSVRRRTGFGIPPGEAGTRRKDWKGKSSGHGNPPRVPSGANPLHNLPVRNLRHGRGSGTRSSGACPSWTTSAGGRTAQTVRQWQRSSRRRLRPRSNGRLRTE